MDKEEKEKLDAELKEGEAFYEGEERVEGQAGAFLPITTFAKALAEAESQQLEEQEVWTSQYGLKSHPFSTSGLLALKRNSVYFDACVKQIAEDVAGKGFNVVLRKEEKENKAEEEALQKFIGTKNVRGESLRSILKMLVRDWGWCGWFGMEVAKNQAEKIANVENNTHFLFHVPAQNLFVHKDRYKYCQRKGDRKAWFKDFDYKKNISAKTGEEIKTKRDFANSMIFYKNYFEESSYYGAPNIYSAVGEVKGTIGLRDYNLAFFENYAVPALLLKLKGKWTKNTVKKINAFLDVEIRGSSAAHKTLSLRIPEGCEAELEKLSTEVKEGSFTELGKKLRDDILSSYRMSPYRLGIAEVGKLGGSTAVEALQNYVENTVEPLQSDMEDLINEKLVREGLGIERYILKFKDIETKDRAAEIDMLMKLFGMACMTPNQVIDITGLGEKYEPDGDQHYISQTYLPIGEEPAEKMRSDLVAFAEDLKMELPKQIKGILSKLGVKR